MVNIYERNGIVVLESIDYNLKIDNNRIIYVRKKEDLSYNSTKHVVDLGLSIEEKKKFLYNLYVAIEKKKKDTLEEIESKN